MNTMTLREYYQETDLGFLEWLEENPQSCDIEEAELNRLLDTNKDELTEEELISVEENTVYYHESLEDVSKHADMALWFSGVATTYYRF